MTRSYWNVVKAGVLALAILAGGAAAQAADLSALQERVGKLTPEQQAALLLLLDTFEGKNAAAPAADAPAEAPAATPAPAAAEAAAAPAADARPDAIETMKQYANTIIESGKKGDLDAVMAIVSEEFEHPEVGGKEDLKDFLQNAIDMGYIETYAEDVEFDFSDAELEQDGDEISVYPVALSSAMGSVTLEFVAKWENGKWMITTLEVEGV